MGGGADRLWTLRLALVPGVGPRIFRALLERFGSAEGVLLASQAELRTVPGVGSKLSRRVQEARDTDVAEQLAGCERQGIEVLTEDDLAYPENLRQIDDPPLALFRSGDWQERDTLAIGIVGTRHASSYGRRQSERLARSLALAGLTVVSGLARGIDAAAHRGALSVGGRTIAVLGSGVLDIYPPEHGDLAREIAGSGCLLSESAPYETPRPGSFPRRNRLISGLCLGIVVVEAPARSGALITAEFAMEQGREVFAVPGPIDSRTSRGCHQLLREGAKLVESAEDVFDELGPLFSNCRDMAGEVRHPGELQLNDQERQILQAIETTVTSVEAVVDATGLPVQRVLSTVSVLEMKRLVRRVSGTTMIRV